MLTFSEIQFCYDANISMFLQLQCKTYKVFVFTHLFVESGGSGPGRVKLRLLRDWLWLRLRLTKYITSVLLTIFNRQQLRKIRGENNNKDYFNNNKSSIQPIILRSVSVFILFRPIKTRISSRHQLHITF